MAPLKDIALIDRALVFAGMWAIALGIGGTGLLVASLSLPAVEAAVATGCGAVLWAFAIATLRMCRRTFRSRVERKRGAAT